MAAKTRKQLQDVFESGDTPSGQDFVDLIDSFLLVKQAFLIDRSTVQLLIDRNTGDLLAKR